MSEASSIHQRQITKLICELPTTSDVASVRRDILSLGDVTAQSSIQAALLRTTADNNLLILTNLSDSVDALSQDVHDALEDSSGKDPLRADFALLDTHVTQLATHLHTDITIQRPANILQLQMEANISLALHSASTDATIRDGNDHRSTVLQGYFDALYHRTMTYSVYWTPDIS